MASRNLQNSQGLQDLIPSSLDFDNSECEGHDKWKLQELQERLWRQEISSRKTEKGTHQNKLATIQWWVDLGETPSHENDIVEEYDSDISMDSCDPDYKFYPHRRERKEDRWKEDIVQNRRLVDTSSQTITQYDYLFDQETSRLSDTIDQLFQGNLHIPSFSTSHVLQNPHEDIFEDIFERKVINLLEDFPTFPDKVDEDETGCDTSTSTRESSVSKEKVMEDIEVMQEEEEEDVSSLKMKFNDMESLSQESQKKLQDELDLAKERLDQLTKLLHSSDVNEAMVTHVEADQNIAPLSRTELDLPSFVEHPLYPMESEGLSTDPATLVQSIINISSSSQDHLVDIEDRDQDIEAPLNRPLTDEQSDLSPIQPNDVSLFLERIQNIVVPDLPTLFQNDSQLDIDSIGVQSPVGRTLQEDSPDNLLPQADDQSSSESFEASVLSLEEEYLLHDNISSMNHDAIQEAVSMFNHSEWDLAQSVAASTPTDSSALDDSFPEDVIRNLNELNFILGLVDQDSDSEREDFDRSMSTRASSGGREEEHDEGEELDLEREEEQEVQVEEKEDDVRVIEEQKEEEFQVEETAEEEGQGDEGKLEVSSIKMKFNDMESLYQESQKKLQDELDLAKERLDQLTKLLHSSDVNEAMVTHVEADSSPPPSLSEPLDLPNFVEHRLSLMESEGLSTLVQSVVNHSPSSQEHQFGVDMDRNRVSVTASPIGRRLTPVSDVQQDDVSLFLERIRTDVMPDLPVLFPDPQHLGLATHSPIRPSDGGGSAPEEEEAEEEEDLPEKDFFSDDGDNSAQFLEDSVFDCEDEALVVARDLLTPATLDNDFSEEVMRNLNELDLILGLREELRDGEMEGSYDDPASVSGSSSAKASNESEAETEEEEFQVEETAEEEGQGDEGKLEVSSIKMKFNDKESLYQESQKKLQDELDLAKERLDQLTKLLHSSDVNEAMVTHVEAGSSPPPSLSEPLDLPNFVEHRLSLMESEGLSTDPATLVESVVNHSSSKQDLVEFKVTEMSRIANEKSNTASFLNPDEGSGLLRSSQGNQEPPLVNEFLSHSPLSDDVQLDELASESTQVLESNLEKESHHDFLPAVSSSSTLNRADLSRIEPVDLSIVFERDVDVNTIDRSLTESMLGTAAMDNGQHKLFDLLDFSDSDSDDNDKGDGDDEIGQPSQEDHRDLSQEVSVDLLDQSSPQDSSSEEVKQIPPETLLSSEESQLVKQSSAIIEELQLSSASPPPHPSSPLSLDSQSLANTDESSEESFHPRVLFQNQTSLDPSSDSKENENDLNLESESCLRSNNPHPSHRDMPPADIVEHQPVTVRFDLSQTVLMNIIKGESIPTTSSSPIFTPPSLVKPSPARLRSVRPIPPHSSETDPVLENSVTVVASRIASKTSHRTIETQTSLPHPQALSHPQLQPLLQTPLKSFSSPYVTPTSSLPSSNQRIRFHSLHHAGDLWEVQTIEHYISSEARAYDESKEAIFYGDPSSHLPQTPHLPHHLQKWKITPLAKKWSSGSDERFLKRTPEIIRWNHLPLSHPPQGSGNSTRYTRR